MQADVATPLLNCHRARIRAEAGEYENTNPYSNLFGENYTPIRRRQFMAFEALNNYGIGHETNNYYDDELLYPRGSLPDHPRYGDILLTQTRTNYREDPQRYFSELRQKLIAQRRRLFFVMPDVKHKGDRARSPWHLSILHYGDLYVNALLSNNQHGKRSYVWTRAQILLGLNRTLTFSLNETSDRLWLTQPSGVYMGMDVPLLVGQPISWKGYPYFLELNPPLQPGRPPQLELIRAEDDIKMSELAITPSLFEYLMRVAAGALPTSFSNQCFQDIRKFQIKCVGSIQQYNRVRDIEVRYVAIETNRERLSEAPIGILEEGR